MVDGSNPFTPTNHLNLNLRRRLGFFSTTMEPKVFSSSMVVLKNHPSCCKQHRGSKEFSHNRPWMGEARANPVRWPLLLFCLSFQSIHLVWNVHLRIALSKIKFPSPIPNPKIQSNSASSSQQPREYKNTGPRPMLNLKKKSNSQKNATDYRRNYQNDSLCHTLKL